MFGATEGAVIESDGAVITAAASNAKAGMSAIVIYSRGGVEAIGAKCATIDADGKAARLKCEPFTLYDQDSVPTLTLTIKKGDKVIFSPLSRSAIAIAPNADRLIRAQSKRPNLRYVHPDLFAHELVKNGETRPSVKDFRAFCDRYLVGAIVFAFSDGDYLTDCQTFATLEISPDSAAANARQAFPFFNRLGIASEAIGDFDAYYKRLLSKEF
jgi:hypothetical protein